MIEHGCSLTTTEMVSVEGLIRNGERTFDLLRLADNEKPEMAVVQFFGADPSSFSKSVEILLKQYRPLCIDINAGCSVRKVVKTGAGVALMGNPKKAHDIIKAMKDVDSSLLVSIKFRLGLNYDSVSYLDFAEHAAQAGADIMTLHPRTASQGFSGAADHARTKALKEAFPEKIVIASGDAFEMRSVDEVLSLSSCDAVMMARGLIGNPFAFEGRNKTEVPSDERIAAYNRHYELLKHYEGERKADFLIRKFAKAYLSGIDKCLIDGVSSKASMKNALS